MAIKFRQFYRQDKPRVTKEVKKEIPKKRIEASKAEDKSLAVFGVGKEWFAIELDAILEIIHSFELISVPHLPVSFIGVVNLRGESVPVIDLRSLLKEKEPDEDKTEVRPCLITIIDDSKIGFLVDTEVEIVNFNEGKFSPLPDIYSKEEAKFLAGIFWYQDRFAGVLKPRELIDTLTEWRQNDET